MACVRRATPAAIVAVVCAALVAAALPAGAAERGSRPPVEWVSGPGRDRVHVTLEGSPPAVTAVATAAVVRAAGASATFFVPARWLERNRWAATAVLLSGSSFGNRGYGPRPFTKLSTAAVRTSVRRAESVLRDLGAGRLPFVRPPDGLRDRRVVEAIASLGYGVLRWSHRPRSGSVGDIAASTLAAAGPGDIVAFDLDRRAHRDAIGLVAAGLSARDLEVVGAHGVRGGDKVRWRRPIGPGASGPGVLRLERALSERTYPAGAVDGVFDDATLQAVYAFEKVHGLDRDGTVSPQERSLLEASDPPAPPRTDVDDYVYVDVGRQVLLEVRGGAVATTIPVSTANGEQYVSDGETRVAHTPRGDFEVLWKIPGWRVSDLGELYYPVYFQGAGYAIHGSPSVPPYPASHGCVRIPMHLAEDFYGRTGPGTPIFVAD